MAGWGGVGGEGVLLYQPVLCSVNPQVHFKRMIKEPSRSESDNCRAVWNIISLNAERAQKCAFWTTHTTCPDKDMSPAQNAGGLQGWTMEVGAA